MQELLDKLSPHLQSTAKELTNNRRAQEDLRQEMCLHLCQLWQEAPNQPLNWYIQRCREYALDAAKADPDSLRTIQESRFKTEFIGHGLFENAFRPFISTFTKKLRRMIGQAS